MDIKIRSQVKGILADCTNKDIKLGGKVTELNQVIASDFGGITTLGTYKDMDRAIEIIDFIQEVISSSFEKKETGIVIIMPEE